MKHNRSFSIRFAVGACLVALAPWPASAMDALERLAASALAEAPRLRAARERLAAASERAAAAGVLADPMLELEVMDAVPGGGRPLEARPRIVQPLPGRGKRAAERAIAAADVELARAELVAEQRRVISDLRSAWAELWRSHRERELQMEAHELMQAMAENAAARLEGGEGSLREALEARVRVRRHEQEQEEGDARYLQALSRLAEIAGGGEGAVVPHVGELGEAPFPDLDIAVAARTSPLVGVERRRVELAAARLAATRLERRPNWSVAGGTRSMRGDSTELVFGVGVELPLFRRRRVAPAIAAAELEVEAAEAERSAVELATRGALERFYVDRFRIENQLARQRQGLLPETFAAYEAARAELLDGTGSIERALALLEEWIGGRREEVRLEAERFALGAALAAHLVDDSLPGGAR